MNAKRDGHQVDIDLRGGLGGVHLDGQPMATTKVQVSAGTAEPSVVTLTLLVMDFALHGDPIVQYEVQLLTARGDHTDVPTGQADTVPGALRDLAAKLEDES